MPGPLDGIRIIDLRGRTVVPGIIDNHNHIVLMGNRPGYHTPLENAFSIRDVQETLAARAKGIPRGGWITTIGGFHRNHFFPPGQMPRPGCSTAGLSPQVLIEYGTTLGPRSTRGFTDFTHRMTRTEAS